MIGTPFKIENTDLEEHEKYHEVMLQLSQIKERDWENKNGCTCEHRCSWSLKVARSPEVRVTGDCQPPDVGAGN